MLIGIPDNLSPELMKILMEMGHGDEIVLADGNFPAAEYARRLVRADGHGVVGLLDSILRFLPLDSFVESPAICMEVVAGDTTKPAIWEEFSRLLKKHHPDAGPMTFIERFDFYDRSKRAFAILATGERALYANIILKKGVVRLKP